MSNKQPILSNAEIVARGPRNRSKPGTRMFRPKLARTRAHSSGGGIKSLLKCGADVSLYGVASGPYWAPEAEVDTQLLLPVPPVPPRSCTLLEGEVGAKLISHQLRMLPAPTKTYSHHSALAFSRRTNAKSRKTATAAVTLTAPVALGVALGSTTVKCLERSLPGVSNNVSVVRCHSTIAGLRCVRPTSPAWESLFGDTSSHLGRSEVLPDASEVEEVSSTKDSPDFADLASFSSFPLPPHLPEASLIASHALDSHSGSLYTLSTPPRCGADAILHPEDKSARRKGLLPPAKRLHSRSLSIFREAQQLDVRVDDMCRNKLEDYCDHGTDLDQHMAELKRGQERARALRALDASNFEDLTVALTRNSSSSPSSFDAEAFQYSLTEMEVEAERETRSVRTRSSSLSSYGSSILVLTPSTMPASMRCRSSTLSSCSYSTRTRSPPLTSPPSTPLPPIPMSPARSAITLPASSKAVRGFAGPLRPLTLSSPIQLAPKVMSSASSASAVTTSRSSSPSSPSPYKSRRIRYVRSSVAAPQPTRKWTKESMEDLPLLPAVPSMYAASSPSSRAPSPQPSPSSSSLSSRSDRSTRLTYTSWTPDCTNFTPVRISFSDTTSPLVRRQHARLVSSSSSASSFSSSSSWNDHAGSMYSSAGGTMSSASSPPSSSPSSYGAQSPCSAYSQLSDDESGVVDGDARETSFDFDDAQRLLGSKTTPETQPHREIQPRRKSMRNRLDELFAVSDDAEMASVHYAYAVRV